MFGNERKWKTHINCVALDRNSITGFENNNFLIEKNHNKTKRDETKRSRNDKRKKKAKFNTAKKSQIKFETLFGFGRLLFSAFSLVLIKLREQIKKKVVETLSLHFFWRFTCSNFQFWSLFFH